MKTMLLALALAVACAGFVAAQQREILAPLDQAVNAMFEAAGVPNRDATRVVPIESSGESISGYAQIAGPRAAVAATRAVVQISTTAPNGWTIQALIPVRSVNRQTGALQREYGVGVDAIVNGRI